MEAVMAVDRERFAEQGFLIMPQIIPALPGFYGDVHV
jgi:hypothetical protein